MSSLKLLLFGNPCIQRNGEIFERLEPLLAGFLAYLAVSCREYERHEIAHLFWPDISDPRDNLRRNISHLKKKLTSFDCLQIP